MKIAEIYHEMIGIDFWYFFRIFQVNILVIHLEPRIAPRMVKVASDAALNYYLRKTDLQHDKQDWFGFY